MKLSEDALNRLKVVVILLQHYTTMEETLKRELQRLVKEDTGVDTNENWNLDIESGELSEHP